MTYQKRNSRSNILKWTEQLAQKKRNAFGFGAALKLWNICETGNPESLSHAKTLGGLKILSNCWDIDSRLGRPSSEPMRHGIRRAMKSSNCCGPEWRWVELEGASAPVCVACLTCLYFTYSITIHCPYSPYMFCDCLITDGYKSQWCGGTYLDANVQRCLKYLHRNCTGQAHILPLFFAGSVARSCWQAVKPWVNIFRHGSTAIGPSYWAWTWWASIDMPAKLA